MKTYKSKGKSILYLGYRLVNQVVDPIRAFFGIKGYVWYIQDLMKFKSLDKKTKIGLLDIYPMLHEKTISTEFDAHYFYQQLWVFENVLKDKPKEHIDVGSTYQMSGYLSKICKTTFVDIRPIETKLNNLTVVKGDTTNLSFKDKSIESLSCLNVIEHIGLGRYGDELDPDGWKKACKELERVLAKNGKLYISVPIGKPRICFNAHRVFSPGDFVKIFSRLKLLEFNTIDDEKNYLESVPVSDYEEVNYNLGMFIFVRRS